LLNHSANHSAHHQIWRKNHHQSLQRFPQDLAKVLDDLLRAVVSLREVRAARMLNGIFGGLDPQMMLDVDS